VTSGWIGAPVRAAISAWSASATLPAMCRSMSRRATTRAAICSDATAIGSELMAGSYLHLACSQCTQLLHDTAATAHCTQPGQRWDAACVQAAQTQCTASQRMATHNECAQGAGIGEFASGCAARVDADLPHESCRSTWNGECVNHANAQCTGGQELYTRTHIKTVGSAAWR
jgi:hypothetical protein